MHFLVGLNGGYMYHSSYPLNKDHVLNYIFIKAKLVYIIQGSQISLTCTCTYTNMHVHVSVNNSTMSVTYI